VLIGAVAGTPGATYVTALHQLVTGKSLTAAQAVAVVDFVLTEFSLVIIPFAFWSSGPRAPRRGCGTPGLADEPRAAADSRRRHVVGACMVIGGLSDCWPDLLGPSPPADSNQSQPGTPGVIGPRSAVGPADCDRLGRDRSAPDPTGH